MLNASVSTQNGSHDNKSLFALTIITHSQFRNKFQFHNRIQIQKRKHGKINMPSYCYASGTIGKGVVCYIVKFLYHPLWDMIRYFV